MIEIWIEGRGVGKARPRLGRNGVYMSDRYSIWKRDAILQIQSLSLPQLEMPVAVECLFVNFFSSDCDNLCGSILDSLVQSGVLQNDSSSFVVGCSGRFCKTKKLRGQDKPVGILVRIFRGEIEYLDLTLEELTPSTAIISTRS